MTSRFTGRDYSSLRTEILDFLKQRLPSDWDYTNLSDPVVIFAESLARVGDQLHFTIDELRRECDMATAKRASSIYSYAIREGYKMMLPKCSFGTIAVNCSSDKESKILLSLHKFDEISVESTGEKLYVVDDNDISSGYAFNEFLHAVPSQEYIDSLKEQYSDYASYVKALYSRTAHIRVVLGEKGTYNFTFNDINNDSTVDLPDPFIDRDAIRLVVTDNEKVRNNGEWKCVEDIIGSGFSGNIYTLTPKFIGGAVRLCIEFSSNFRDMFSQTATFAFEYIKLVNSKVDSSNASSIRILDYTYDSETEKKAKNSDLVIDVGSGIKGYTEYEDAATTRANYKKFMQNYSALLTKSDYINYIKSSTSLLCSVYDHSDNWKQNVLPSGTSLITRAIYILTDATYNEREALFYDLQERSSRSDCFVMIPYGKDPYTIVVKAECYLLGTSISTISTQIKTALMKYYSGYNVNNPPNTSKISYLVHKASDKVAQVNSCIVRDSTFGTVNTDFNSVNKLSNYDVDLLFKAISENVYYYPGESTEKNEMLEKYLKGTSEQGYSYRKYSTVTYNKFPDAFPDIYEDPSEENPALKIDTYEKLAQHQLIYGDYDTPAFDVNDNEIYEGSMIDGDFVMRIKQSYILHHYMVPYLNRVVVLVKAIDE